MATKKPTGTANKDKLIGTASADKFSGLAGNDTLNGMAGNDTLDGGAGDDSLDGGAGNDSLLGGDGNDILYGRSGNDFLSGDKGNDKLDGSVGNDTLNGGIGSDAMTGGDGNDYYFVDNKLDTVVETNKNKKTGGIDSVETALNYVLGNNVENLILTGITNNNGTGNKSDNVITGNIGDNLLKGDVGNDTLIGGDGVDTLDGGLGMDILNGGTGADVYFMNNTEDQIIEDEQSTDEDQVIATVSYDLSANPTIEILTLQGKKALSGIGNELDNTLQEVEGGTVANSFNGAAGDDVINAEGGDDTLEGGEGNDELNGGAGNDVAIYNGLFDDYQITPNVDVEGVAQLVIKHVNPNDIDEGEDILSDIEIVQFSDGTQKTIQAIIDGEEEPVVEIPIEKPVDVGEVGTPALTPVEEKPIEETKPVVEIPTEKPVETKPDTPTVSADKLEIEATKPPADMIFDWDFSQTEADDNLDIVNLPNAKNIRIMGLAGNDTIHGGSAVRWIDGGEGNDSILGGDGTADTLLGGVGDDLLSAGASQSDYYAEHDSAKNVLSGGLGNDTLIGGIFDDLLIGGIGDDKIYGDAVGGYIYQIGNGNDTLIGGAGNDTLFDLEGNNSLDGGAGSDAIRGGGGSDTLIGGTEVDTITGDGGADTFIFVKGDSGVGKGNRDITDFDFSVAGEVMDLSAIADGKLTYEAMKPFSAINQVRYEMDFVTTTTIVKLNLDNDPKTTEMEIELTGFKNLTADDFVLVKNGTS